ncbi:MAG: UPF0158 family protein [Ignavibacteriaceae bacterium]
MELTQEQISEIAEELECGMRVFVHVDTKEIQTIIDWENSLDFDEEIWKDVIDEIEGNAEKYVEFEKMSSNESFAVMEEFVETVDNEELQKKLELGLSLSKPFRNFKDIVDNFGGEYRKKWFEFKKNSYIDWVITQLDHYNNNPQTGTDDEF